MFFPEEMTELQLIIPSKDLLAVTKVLGSRGVFHQIDSTYLGLENLGPSTWQEKAAGYSTLERRIQSIMQTLNLEEKYSGSSEFESPVDLETLRLAVERIEAEVKSTSDQLTAEKKKLEQFESQLHQLAPIAGTNVEVGALRKSRYLHSILGIIPEENKSRLETSLARVPYIFFTLDDKSKKQVVWLLGPRSNSDILDRAAKSALLNPLTLPEELEGTPKEITESLGKAIETSRQKISELEAALAKLAETHSKELYKLLGDVHISRMTADAIVRYGQLRHTYVVVGWVPTSDLDTLTQRLKQASKEILIEAIPAERMGHQSNAPVVLKNSWYFKPFEFLVNTYARPRYNELDPTFLIGITFPLLYGIMFADLGQGLLLALLGFIFREKILLFLPGRTVVACGISGAIFGLLFGSVFGFEEILPHHPFLGQFVLFQPIHSILGILFLAMGLGAILLNLAMLLNLFGAARNRNWGQFLFDSNGLFGWLLYVSFLVFLLELLSGVFAGKHLFPGVDFPVIAFPAIVKNFATLFFVAGLLLAVIFSHPIKHWMEGHHFEIEGGWVGFSIQSAAEVFEKLLSMFSNTLSYVRVGAFAIVHAGFMVAVFVVARLVGGGEEGSFAYWAVVVVGNLGVLLLEAFIVGIQTLRLHFYEFFTKFFNGGGAAFEPLALATAQDTK